MASATQVTVSQLQRLIGTPDCPILIDICIDEDFAADPRLIPGAFRHSFTEIENLVPTVRGGKVVIICQKGLKLSQGAAAILRSEGVDARFLEGGNFAWRDAGEKLVPADSIPARNQNGQTTWVIGHNLKMDTSACCWLIKRFIDPKARFLFVSTPEVKQVAERYNATSISTETENLAHENGAFSRMLDKFHLQTKILLKVATIIDGRDPVKDNRPDETSGFIALSLGLSSMLNDDLKQLEAGLLIHDALYSWARDVTEETDSSSTAPVKG